jgi:YD repeat-containing protein
MKFLSVFAAIVFASQVFAATQTQSDNPRLGHIMNNLRHYTHGGDSALIKYKRSGELRRHSQSIAEGVKMHAHTGTKDALDSIVTLKKYKEVFTYNTSGLVALETTYAWDSTSSDWFLSYKSEYTYNANGNMLTEIDYYNTSTPITWTPSYKYEYTYDAAGNMLTEIDYNYTSTSSAWVPSYKYEYTYDTAGNMLTKIDYDYNSTSSAWVPSYKYECAYDTKGNMLTAIYYDYNSTSETWDSSHKYKYEYTYDASGNILTEMGYDSNTTSYAWDSSDKYEYSYDVNGNVLIYTEYNYDTTFSAWVPSSKEELTYDLSISITDVIVPTSWYSYYKNKLLGFINYEWDTLSSTWVSSYIYTLNYSSFNVPVIKYPVASAKPFSIEKKSDNIRINFNSATPLVASLCNASGRRLICKNVKSGGIVDISDLAPGIYILGISGNDGVARSCRILKE